jgi:hypothetical protein
MGCASTGEPVTETASISFADIERLRIEMLTKFGRAPRAIWFVDRPAQLDELLREVASMAVEAPNPYVKPDRVHVGTLYGIPVKEWNRATATAEERKRAPAFVDLPGVWVEMADGRHVRIGEEG